MLQNGLYTNEDASEIFSEYIAKRDKIYQKYNLQENSTRGTANEINAFKNTNARNSINPNNINNVAISTVQNSPGNLASRVSKSRNIFSRIFQSRDNNDKNR